MKNQRDRKIRDYIPRSFLSFLLPLLVILFLVGTLSAALADGAPSESFGPYSLTGTNQYATAYPLYGQNSIGVQITGTFSGTLVAACIVSTQTAPTSFYSFLSGVSSTASETAPAVVWIACPSSLEAEIYFNSYVSGTAVVSLYATQASIVLPNIPISNAGTTIPPGGYIGTSGVLNGNGNTNYYYEGAIDVLPTWTSKQTSTSATVELVAGIANEDMKVYWAGYQIGGSSLSSLATQLIDGTGSTCSGSTQSLTPIAVPALNTSTAGQLNTIIGSDSSVLAVSPLRKPITIVSGATPVNLCAIITASSNTSGEYFGVVATLGAN